MNTASREPRRAARKIALAARMALPESHDYDLILCYIFSSNRILIVDLAIHRFASAIDKLFVGYNWADPSLSLVNNIIARVKFWDYE